MVQNITWFTVQYIYSILNKINIALVSIIYLSQNIKTNITDPKMLYGTVYTV